MVFKVKVTHQKSVARLTALNKRPRGRMSDISDGTTKERTKHMRQI